MQDVLHHQAADGGIPRNHLHSARIGPLDHRKLAHILDFSHHEG